MSLTIRAAEGELQLWNDPKELVEIRKIFAPKLNDMEFAIFTAMGRATGLNPYLREIWAVKYDGDTAQIFIGRDGYRKSAQRHPLYDYHTCDAVYSNDQFGINHGEVVHKPNLQDRGHLVGAYAIAQRKGSSRPSYVFAELAEYSSGKALWRDAKAKGKPATMIKKVAEAQVLKMCYQELFAGSYHEFEQWEHDEKPKSTEGKGIRGLEEKLGIEPDEPVIDNVIDADVVVTDEIVEEGLTIHERLMLAQNQDELTSILKDINAIESMTEKKELMHHYREFKKMLGV